MSTFAQEWASASANIDTFFGEAFNYMPMALIGGKMIVDASRGAMAITAAFDSAAAVDDVIGQRNMSGVSKDVASKIATMHATVDIASSALPYPPRAKDRLTRLVDGAIFEVSAVLQDDFARITLRVMKIGIPG